MTLFDGSEKLLLPLVMSWKGAATAILLGGAQHVECRMDITHSLGAADVVGHARKESRGERRRNACPAHDAGTGGRETAGASILAGTAACINDHPGRPACGSEREVREVATAIARLAADAFLPSRLREEHALPPAGGDPVGPLVADDLRDVPRRIAARTPGASAAEHRAADADNLG